MKKKELDHSVFNKRNLLDHPILNKKELEHSALIIESFLENKKSSLIDNCDFKSSLIDDYDFESPLTILWNLKQSLKLDAEGHLELSFGSAVVFSDSTFLHPLPKTVFGRVFEKVDLHKKIEDDIEEILEHEDLHKGMFHLDLEDESYMFDNIVPKIGNWNELINRL